MKTVKEVSLATGISVRTLHHYDAIGLLKPTQVTEAGYRLYDESAVECLSMILVYRELGLSLKEIGNILDAPEDEQNRILEDQMIKMQEKVSKLQNRVSLARGMLTVGINHMNLKDFDAPKIEEYGVQAKTLYGRTDAYREYEQKSKSRNNEQEKALGQQVMDFFARLGALRPCAPDYDAALDWAKGLQAFLTEHYYTCTPRILQSLAESYAGGGSMTENIDKVGGAGTGAFAKEVINAYIQQL